MGGGAESRVRRFSDVNRCGVGYFEGEGSWRKLSTIGTLALGELAIYKYGAAGSWGGLQETGVTGLDYRVFVMYSGFRPKHLSLSFAFGFL